MLKKLWLVLAASAVLAAGQVSATEIAEEVIAEEVTEVTTEVTQAEIEEAVVLAQALIDGDITASDLSAVETLQKNRTKRSNLIKTIAYVTVGSLVLAGGGYLAYNHFYSEKEQQAPAPTGENPAAGGNQANLNNTTPPTGDEAAAGSQATPATHMHTQACSHRYPTRGTRTSEG
jgi:hypothetical protein